MKFETRAIHVGQTPDGATGAVIPPIFATSTFAQTRPGETLGYDYTRSGNPNFTRLGETIASLEGGSFATVFGSGMAAVTAVLSTFLRTMSFWRRRTSTGVRSGYSPRSSRSLVYR